MLIKDLGDVGPPLAKGWIRDIAQSAREKSRKVCRRANQSTGHATWKCLRTGGKAGPQKDMFCNRMLLVVRTATTQKWTPRYTDSAGQFHHLQAAKNTLKKRPEKEKRNPVRGEGPAKRTRRGQKRKCWKTCCYHPKRRKGPRTYPTLDKKKGSKT